MNTSPQTLMQRIARLGLILMIGAVMSACSSDQHWKEEVQLSDGKVIVVERDLLTESGGDEWALNRTGSKPKEYRIRFEYPFGSGKTVEWRSTKIDMQTYPEIPLVLDMVSDAPVIFSSGYVRGCQMYFKYRWEGGWIEEPLPPQFDKRATNLFLKFSAAPSMVDIETKRKLNSEIGFRHIQQVGPKHPYCH